MRCVSLGQPLGGREACSELLKPPPCGPAPRESHDAGHEPQWSERPSAPSGRWCKLPDHPLGVTDYAEQRFYLYPTQASVLQTYV